MKRSIIILAIAAVLLTAFRSFAEVLVKNADDKSYIVTVSCETYQEFKALSSHSFIGFELPADGCSVIVKATGSRIAIDDNGTYLVADGQVTEE